MRAEHVQITAGIGLPLHENLYKSIKIRASCSLMLTDLLPMRPKNGNCIRVSNRSHCVGKKVGNHFVTFFQLRFECEESKEFFRAQKIEGCIYPALLPNSHLSGLQKSPCIRLYQYPAMAAQRSRLFAGSGLFLGGWLTKLGRQILQIVHSTRERSVDQRCCDSSLRPNLKANHQIGASDGDERTQCRSPQCGNPLRNYATKNRRSQGERNKDSRSKSYKNPRVGMAVEPPNRSHTTPELYENGILSC